MAVSPKSVNVGEMLGLSEDVMNLAAVAAFALLAIVLAAIGGRKADDLQPPGDPSAPPPGQPDTRIQA